MTRQFSRQTVVGKRGRKAALKAGPCSPPAGNRESPGASPPSSSPLSAPPRLPDSPDRPSWVTTFDLGTRGHNRHDVKTDSSVKTAVGEGEDPAGRRPVPLDVPSPQWVPLVKAFIDARGPHTSSFFALAGEREAPDGLASIKCEAYRHFQYSKIS